MHEITPDLIARIASRLYNGASQGDPTPLANGEARQIVSQVGQPSAMPAPPAMPVDVSGDGLAAPSPPGYTVPGSTGLSPPSTESLPIPASSRPALPVSIPGGFEAVPGGLASSRSSLTTPPGGIPAAPGGLASPPHGTDGLRAFVEKIRTAHLHPGDGLLGDAYDHNSLARRFPARGLSATGARPFDVAEIRREFPILNQRVHGKPLAWLDNAATTQKPQSVIDALASYYANDNSNIHRGAHTLAARSTDAFEGARQKVQRFLGAGSPREIIFVRGTTEGINLISQTYGRKFLQSGDEIILSTLEHHANIVPWQMVAKEKGAVIRVIPVTDRGEVMLEDYQALLGPRTRLVALTHASNSLGTILPVMEMTRMAKRYNARVLIDGAQSVSHMPVNVQQLGCDFFVFSGHKIFGPTGIGAVYAKEELLEIMPPWQGGGNMIRNVTFEETTYAEPPAKFEAGTPNIADTVGLGAALDYVTRLGLPNIAKYEQGLLQYATEQLSRIAGLRLIGTAREKVGVLSFVLRDRPTEEVGRMLDQEGIAVRAGHHCSQPSLRRFGVESTVRPSLAFYNTTDEIDRLVDAIKHIQRG